MSSVGGYGLFGPVVPAELASGQVFAARTPATPMRLAGTIACCANELPLRNDIGGISVASRSPQAHDRVPVRRCMCAVAHVPGSMTNSRTWHRAPSQQGLAKKRHVVAADGAAAPLALTVGDVESSGALAAGGVASGEVGCGSEEPAGGDRDDDSDRTRHPSGGGRRRPCGAAPWRYLSHVVGDSVDGRACALAG